MADIKILVSCHKESYVPKSKFLYPIQVGAEISNKKYTASYYDNQGDHISGENKFYCELTAQYWAWKQLKAEYYGFFHYRRYMVFQKEYPVGADGKLFVKNWRPYTEAENIREWEYSDKKLEEIITKYDILTVLREPMKVSVYGQYCQFHKKEDIDRMLHLLKQMYPKYQAAAEEYMASKEHYFLNMYIMKKELFYAYMEWLFPLLEAFKASTDFSGYSEQEYRAPAFLAERLFGIYFTYIKKQKEKKCCELSYQVFSATEPYPCINPIYPEGSINLVMASDNSFSPYLGVLMQSIVDCALEENVYDIVILHRQIAEENQKRILRIKKGKENISIRFCNISDYVAKIPFQVHHHFSVETFYRYFIPEVMKGYQKVLYLDVDIVVKKDIAGLFQEDITGYALAAVRDVDVIGSAKVEEDVKEYLEKELGLKEVRSYFQAGVLLINLDEIRKYPVSKLIEITLKKTWRMLDQDVLNMVFQGKVKALPQNWNVLINWKYGGRSRIDIIKNAPFSLWKEYQDARKQPYIIHYAGAWKPWNMPSCDYAEEFWDYARKTPFYESILCETIISRKYTSITEENSNKRIFRLRPTKLEIAVDMKKINKLMPPGSKRRVWVRQLFKKFL